MDLRQKKLPKGINPMKKLLTLTMAGVCALAFAAAADAGTTLRMKAPTVKTATRTQSNIVGSGNVEVQYVYSDWSTCATNYKTAEGGKYEVTTLYLGNLLTSQQVYDDLRDKFLTTEFDYTRTAMNGTSTQTVSKQQIGLLSTLVPSVADETLLTAVVSVGANYNGQSKGNNYYDFNSTSDRDGKFVYSDFATVSSSGILNDKVIPGRVASYTGIGTEAADLSAAANSNNGKVFSAAEAAAKADELKDLFYVSEKANWDNQQEANKIGVQNLVAKLQARYDEFTNAQMSAMGHVQDTLDAIVAGLANGTMSYADALAKLQGIIDGIKNFDNNGYNALLNDYANQLAALKNAYESNYAGTKLQLAKELQALKDSNAKKLADYTAQLAGELQALKTANAEALAALESNLSRELSVLKATNASAYAEASEKADADKAALESTRDNTIAKAAADRNKTIQAAKDAVAAYEAASNTYSNIIEQAADERDGIKDNYDSKISDLEVARDAEIDSLTSERDSKINSLTSARNSAVSTATSKVNNYKSLKSQLDARSVSEYNSAVSTVNNINSEFDRITVGLNSAINAHMGPNGNSYCCWYSGDTLTRTSYITGISNVSYDQYGHITAYTMECICRSQEASTTYAVGEAFSVRKVCTDSNSITGGNYLDWIDTMSADYYTNSYQPYRTQIESQYKAARQVKDSYESLQTQVNSAYSAINGDLNYAKTVSDRYNTQIGSVASDYNSRISSAEASYNSQIAAAEANRTAELNALSEKYYGENGIATKAKASMEAAKAACDGNPSTYVANQTSKANSTYASKEAAANNAYQSGVAEVEASLAALKTANDKAEASKLAANNAQIAAKKDSNAKAEASKLAANNGAIAGMKTDNANKEAAKLAANNAALKAIDDKYAADKLALEKKAEAALAAFVLDQFTAMQNADNNAKLAELKAELTAYINSLKDSKGNAYSTDKILGYDTMQFNQVAYKTIAYNKKYSAADFAAEEAKGTFAVDEAEIAEVEVGDNQFLSALSVSSKNKVTMVDGVLQEVTTNTESLYLTSIYLEVGRKYISPIVLDLKGDGVLQASDGQHMPGHSYVKNNNIVTDFYGDGFEIAMEWVGPQDGLLVAPKADGSVDMSCLFGVAGGYESGYEKLSLYDKNNDDKVSGDELKGLSVWQDANSNGIADAGEVKTVQELGITSIGITNSLDFTSSFERNGQSYKMWDWWPNAVELIKVAAK